MWTLADLHIFSSSEIFTIIQHNSAFSDAMERRPGQGYSGGWERDSKRGKGKTKLAWEQMVGGGANMSACEKMGRWWWMGKGAWKADFNDPTLPQAG